MSTRREKRRTKCNSRINTKTNRCVRMSGKIGSKLRGRPICCKKNNTPKKVLKKSSKKPTNRKPTKKVTNLTCIPEKFDEIVRNCQCHKRWGKKIRIGSGANGSIYLACKLNNSKDCEYVVKVQQYNQQAKAEVDAYLHLQGKKLTPKLHAAWLCGGKLYLVIDKVFRCRFSKRDVKAKLDKLYKLGWLYVDVHDGNVMCDKKDNVVMIDFGWAVHKDDQPYKRHPTGLKTFEDLKKVQKMNLDEL